MIIPEYNEGKVIAIAMQDQGGSFVRHLGQALARADPDNTHRIHTAFPEYWNQYRAIAEKHDWYMHE
ncbi:MAG: hypothetical protein GWP10_05635 [Nitrospiraceae bacterium]|nr:hypothetical protein [Nitrospiraceae bacterium]